MIKIEKIGKRLLTTKNVSKSTFFWNAFSSVMNSFQTMLLLMIITRMGNDTDAGIFVMAYAIGNLMIHVGKYGVRQFQVTDVTEKYSYADYVKARYCSLALMLGLSILYVGSNLVMDKYSPEKTIAVLLICILKAIEAFEDVFHGRMQQKGRLDVAGKILGIRLGVFIAGFAVTYLISRNLVLTCIINVLITLLLAIVFNMSVAGEFGDTRENAGKKHWAMILIECLPLCLCMCLNMYIANAPKYTIDTIVSDAVQTSFNIVFMPVFIIALLATFIFQPYLKKIGELWNEDRLKELVSFIGKLTAVVLIISLFITVVGSFIGGPVLGFVYGKDLTGYQKELILFMVAGGVIALQNLAIMVITTVRYQKYMIYGYAVIATVQLFFGKWMLEQFELIGLCIFFLVMLILLTLYCFGLMFVAIRKRAKLLREADNGYN